MDSRQIKSLFRLAVLAVFGLGAALAQSPDTSGNGLLKGTFHFRHLAVQLVDANFDPSEITAVHGTITFDGAGNYTLAGTSVDNGVSSGAPQPLNLSGTYAIGSNGIGYLTNPLYPTDFNAWIYGAVAQGIFIGSSTESEGDMNILNDIFIAIPAGTAPTNANFTSQYQTGLLDFPGANGSAIKNALFELSPNGKGGIGAITMNGQASNSLASSLTQTVSGATYNFNSDGSATLTIPQPSGRGSTNALFTGTKTMFMSADGNFILGWTDTGYDIFFGVKALATTATNSMTAGLYFTAALEDNQGSGFGTDSYYGSSNSTGDSNGDAIVHQRVNVPEANSYDYGTDDQIGLNSDGTTAVDFNGYTYIFGEGGQAFVAIGTLGLYSLQVGLHAPSFSGRGVYLNPTGIVNAASFQPVTASLAPGELIVLYGSGLAPTAMGAIGGQPFPTTAGLAGVTATINGIPCPLYYVTPTQMSVVVPYEVASNQTGLANIQVNNNGVLSNVVQMYLTDSAPGSFSQQASGIGLAAAVHGLTGQLITADNPVQPGEVILLFLTGVGTVTPGVQDGAVGPSGPLSWSDLFEAGNFSVYFNDYAAGSVGNAGTVQFAGLAPTLAGLYQINVQVPSTGLIAGDNVYVSFDTDAAEVNQIQIPYGSGTPTLSAVRAGARAAKTASIRAKRAKNKQPRRLIRRPM